MNLLNVIIIQSTRVHRLATSPPNSAQEERMGGGERYDEVGSGCAVSSAHFLHALRLRDKA
jgi:hypothetical protein